MRGSRSAAALSQQAVSSYHRVHSTRAQVHGSVKEEVASLGSHVEALAQRAVIQGAHVVSLKEPLQAIKQQAAKSAREIVATARSAAGFSRTKKSRRGALGSLAEETFVS